MEGDQALIGLVFGQDEREVTRYFVDEAGVDAAVEGAIAQSLQLVGAWSDLDWEQVEAALDRIRHGSPASLPIEV